jgi:hypothetical protein
VFGSQLVLPGQFVDTVKSLSPSFLEEPQTAMAGHSPPQTHHNSSHAPTNLPGELLLACFVLIRHNAAQAWLAPIYDRHFCMLERSTHFFFLQMGDRTSKVSKLHLKLAQTPANTEPA